MYAPLHCNIPESLEHQSYQQVRLYQRHPAILKEKGKKKATEDKLITIN